MRKLIVLACPALLAAALVGTARGADPAVGELSVEGGKGAVILEVRGSVLGRLASGSIVVTDRTPNDHYAESITGKKIVAERRLGPAKLLVRGQGLRFRMLGGSYRVAIRGTGIAVSAVGRGHVELDGERLFPWEDTGVYSLDGTDCGMEPEKCSPLPDDPIRLKLGARPTEGSPRPRDRER
jgi:hypothetical protein